MNTTLAVENWGAPKCAVTLATKRCQETGKAVSVVRPAIFNRGWEIVDGILTKRQEKVYDVLAVVTP